MRFARATTCVTSRSGQDNGSRRGELHSKTRILNEVFIVFTTRKPPAGKLRPIKTICLRVDRLHVGVVCPRRCPDLDDNYQSSAHYWPPPTSAAPPVYLESGVCVFLYLFYSGALRAEPRGGTAGRWRCRHTQSNRQRFPVLCLRQSKQYSDKYRPNEGR